MATCQKPEGVSFGKAGVKVYPADCDRSYSDKTVAYEKGRKMVEALIGALSAKVDLFDSGVDKRGNPNIKFKLPDGKICNLEVVTKVGSSRVLKTIFRHEDGFAATITDPEILLPIESYLFIARSRSKLSYVNINHDSGEGNDLTIGTVLGTISLGGVGLGVAGALWGLSLLSGAGILILIGGGAAFAVSGMKARSNIMHNARPFLKDACEYLKGSKDMLVRENCPLNP